MASKLLTDVLQWLEEYKNNTDCRGVVLGISGGKDSTVVAMLAKKVWGDNVLGVLMPNGEQSDIDDSVKVVNTLGIEHKCINIVNIVNSLKYAIPMSVTDKAMTNVPPRVRMTVLYTIAQTIGYRVIGTGNASEAYIGWTTKWGDSAYDFNPIYDLTRRDVVDIGLELASEFGLDKTFITKTPSDGLTNKSDEDNFGFTYDALDNYITGEGEVISCEVAEKIEQLHRYSAHKREMPPHFEK